MGCTVNRWKSNNNNNNTYDAREMKKNNNNHKIQDLFASNSETSLLHTFRSTIFQKFMRILFMLCLHVKWEKSWKGFRTRERCISNRPTIHHNHICHHNGFKLQFEVVFLELQFPAETAKISDLHFSTNSTYLKNLKPFDFFRPDNNISDLVVFVSTLVSLGMRTELNVRANAHIFKGKTEIKATHQPVFLFVCVCVFFFHSLLHCYAQSVVKIKWEDFLISLRWALLCWHDFYAFDGNVEGALFRCESLNKTHMPL